MKHNIGCGEWVGLIMIFLLKYHLSCLMCHVVRLFPTNLVLMTCHFPLYIIHPIDNTLLLELGTLIGGCHFSVVMVVRWGTWAVVISRARVPVGFRKATV